MGMRRLVSAVLTDIPWGTEAVMARTRGILSQGGISHALLDVHRDVDKPEDLMVWQEAMVRHPLPGLPD